ncbi:MAG: ribonuclease H-like domain-containing protein, partial [Bryobacteraceae bacterium]
PRNRSEELACLKQRIADIDKRFATKYAVQPAPKEQNARWFIEEWSAGEVVRNEFGEHFQTERLFPAHKRHGSADIGGLAELPKDLLDAAGGGEIPPVPCERWAFLDTETTGLIGGSGTYAFLIGVGRIAREGFRVRQFFVREYIEEGSVLDALADHLREFEILITYNGKSYDQPLLEKRYRLAHREPPFARLAHFDLLPSARRLWKLRLQDCRLTRLEQRLLGLHREGDLPGELIPYVYFEYLHSQEAQRLVPIFHHNAMDLLTLACLTAIVPAAFRSPDREGLARAGVHRAEDLAGIARWLLSAGRHTEALELFRCALSAGLPDAIAFRTLWDVARLEKKLGRANAAVPALTEIASCLNEYRSRALEELAKHYERQEKNYPLALEFTSRALACGSSAALLRRKARLEKKDG